jgi:polar amino acid transport system substrate-binding protein
MAWIIFPAHCKREVSNLKKFGGLVIISVLLLSLVLAISGCTTPTATPAANVTPTPAAGFTHTSVIDNKSYTFTTLQKDTLQVASDAAYPPFENVNTSTGKIEGFDIELMDQICKELNITPVYTNQLFDGIILAVQTKKFDASISAFTINAERQKSVDFSDPYYENKGQAIATKPNSTIKGPADLIGHKVAVQAGTAGQDAVKNLTVNNTTMNAEDIKVYQTMPEAMLALKKGEVDAAAGDYAVMYPYVKNYPGDYEFAPGFLSEVEYFGIIVNKDNKELTAAMNAALAKIKADGRYQVIYDKWFA